MTKKRSLTTVGPFTLGRIIGQGSSGKVKIAIKDSKEYCCKIVKRQTIDQGEEYLHRIEYVSKDLKDGTMDDLRLVREIALTLILDHPYIVSLHEVYISNYHYYLIMDYVNGTQVLDFIISHGRLKEKFAQNLFAQLVSAVDYCHKNGIVHRDLKIENIMINAKGNIQLIDFGLANLYSSKSFLNTFCGSLYFAAPELLNAKKYVGPEVDVWSLGVTLYVLTCGQVPFDDASLPHLHAKIAAGVVSYPSFLSTQLKHLLSRMLVPNLSQRANLDEVISHPWLSKYPVKDFLPKRDPIPLPLDLHVIEKMGGFGFGSKEEIHQKLMDLLATKDGYSEPIVKIYYLVMEKINRKVTESLQQIQAENLQQRQSLLQQNQKRSSVLVPKRNPDELTPLPLRRSKSLVHSEEKKKKHKNFRLDFHYRFKTKGDGDELDGERESRKKKRFSLKSYDKKPERKSENDKFQSSIEKKASKVERNRGSSVTDGPETPKSRKSFSGLKESITDILTIKSEPSLSGETTKQPKKKPSIGEKISGFLNKVLRGKKSIPEPVEEKETVPHPIPQKPKPLSVNTQLNTDDSKLKTSSRPSILSITPFRNSFSSREPHSPTDSIPDPPPNLQYQRLTTNQSDVGQLDDVIEKVAFTGIFSVSTTSTKPPSQIRLEILKVLKKMMKDYQMCYYERRGVVTVLIADQDGACESGGLLSRESFLGSRRPSLSLSTHSTDRESVFREYTGDPSVDNMSRPSKVVFQIRIHKIKMMSMHCIRFHRLEGDTWVYKSLCSRFLEILHW